MILFRSYSPSDYPVAFSNELMLPFASTGPKAPDKQGLFGSAQPHRCIGCSVARHPLPVYGARWKVLHRRVLHRLIILFSAYEPCFGAGDRNIGPSEKQALPDHVPAAVKGHRLAVTAGAMGGGKTLISLSDIVRLLSDRQLLEAPTSPFLVAATTQAILDAWLQEGVASVTEVRQ